MTQKQHIDFGFVILHYMAQQTTEECVDDILNKFSSKTILIVIVDNASPNGSGKKLETKYANNSLVKVLLHYQNSGFAQGNNIGFNYLKDNYDISFMIVMNNDVFIKSVDFLDKITTIYQKHKYSVLGPDIFAPRLSMHQNPGPRNIATIDQTKQFIKQYKSLIRNDNFNYYKLKILHYLVFWWAKPIYNLLFDKQNKRTQNVREEKSNNSKILEYVKNSVLCGACYIFSRDFIQKRKYCFNPATFLYFEEQILAYECQKAGLTMLYSPEIEVEHLIGISSEASHSDNRKRYLTMWQENIKSANIYLEILKKGI